MLKFWPNWGQKVVIIISRISRNFSREMGHFFSHLARNPKREKCACLYTALERLKNLQAFSILRVLVSLYSVTK